MTRRQVCHCDVIDSLGDKSLVSPRCLWSVGVSHKNNLIFNWHTTTPPRCRAAALHAYTQATLTAARDPSPSHKQHTRGLALPISWSCARVWCDLPYEWLLMYSIPARVVRIPSWVCYFCEPLPAKGFSARFSFREPRCRMSAYIRMHAGQDVHSICAFILMIWWHGRDKVSWLSKRSCPHASSSRTQLCTSMKITPLCTYTHMLWKLQLCTYTHILWNYTTMHAHWHSMKISSIEACLRLCMLLL